MGDLLRKVARKAKQAAIETYEKMETKYKDAKRRSLTQARVDRAKTIGKKAAKAALGAAAVAAAVAAIREVRNGRSR